jgi:hypothetical protein
MKKKLTEKLEQYFVIKTPLQFVRNFQLPIKFDYSVSNWGECPSIKFDGDLKKTMNTDCKDTNFKPRFELANIRKTSNHLKITNNDCE